MPKLDWKKYVYKVVIVVLVTFFVAGVGFGAKKILSIEGVRELYTAPAPLSEKPETADEMVQYINSCIEKALRLSPKTERSAVFSVDKGSVQVTENNPQLLNSVKMAVPEINALVNEGFTTVTADYSESAAEILGICIIASSDILSSRLDYEYYKCSLCTSEIPCENYSVVCPECSSENTLQLRSYDTYKITISVSPDSLSFEENPFPKTEALSSVIGNGGGNYYSLKNFSKQPDEAILYAEINRLTDEIGVLRFETVSSFSAELEMSGEYEVLGVATVSAAAKDKLTYSFSWPSVRLDKHEMTVEIGSSEALKAKLTCDDPASYDVVWTSSDESVLTVDDQGYLKTKKVFGDSIVTATFTFNGVEYSDSCLVHVGVPAEGVDLSKGRLSLKTGESAQLEAVFNPKDTTNTRCYWYSENEEIAKVDENGVVTAVAPGKTVIYIISDYGNYYSSCKTEVTD